MSLYDLTYDWFIYLRMITSEGAGLNMTVAEMKSRLVEMLKEMESRFETCPEAFRHLRPVKYALVVFADEMLINSEWARSEDWRAERLEVHFFQSAVGGDQFFSELKEAREKLADPEVIGVYFMCLSLGFKGKYFNRIDALRSLHRELYIMLPQRITSRMENLFPEAYLTEVKKPAQRPVAAMGKAVFSLAFATVIFLFISLFVWIWMT